MEHKRWGKKTLVVVTCCWLIATALGGCAATKAKAGSDASPTTGTATESAKAESAVAIKNLDAVNGQIKVLDLKIGMTEQDLIKALGETEKENCVYGYEMNYEDKQLSVGVNTDGKVRRIKTSNPETSICNIKPGTPLEEATKDVLKAGYLQVKGTKKFEKEGIRVELLSKENKLADQISLEIIEK